mmetsp:Transcript_34366/g.77406  ORF Transcript_34366/g.77406 Transcript_34366/m.77406 type:complete len:413 (-) Transcript_34366:30-1268(-)
MSLSTSLLSSANAAKRTSRCGKKLMMDRHPQGRRLKSTMPFLSSTSQLHDEVYERASFHASSFDAMNNLNEKTLWRSRQIEVTRRTPVEPFPREAMCVIPPSQRHGDGFFPSYAHTGIPGPPKLPPDSILIHDEASMMDRMRKAAKLARRLLDYACHPSVTRVGRTTEEIDRLVHTAALDHGAYPSPLNYRSFPKSICSSVNEVVCHGIPDSRPLELGDLVSFDVSCFVGGVHGDNCASIIVGDLKEDYRADEFEWDGTANSLPSIPTKTQFSSPEEEERFVTARRLVQAALESRDEGVAACKPGACLSDIGAAIHAVCDAYGYDTVKEYRGHGIHSDFHCAPYVKHFRNDDSLELTPGMIFTIEPMLTEGSANCAEWSDNWTVATDDKGRAAQFEHQVLITESGVEILTQP